MFVSAQNTIVLLITNSSQYDNGLRLYYLLLIYCTSASRTGPCMFALDFECRMALHNPVLRECRVHEVLWRQAYVMCQAAIRISSEAAWPSYVTWSAWDGRKKFDLIKILWSRTRLSMCPLGQWSATVFFFRAGLTQTRLSSRSSSACDWSNCCLIRPGREEQDKQTNLTRHESH